MVDILLDFIKWIGNGVCGMDLHGLKGLYIEDMIREM